MSQSLIHEVNSAGQHRIVIIKEGVPKASPWAEHHAIAVLGQYRATYKGNDALPTGIFTVSSKDYEGLGV